MNYVGIDLGTTNSAICSFDGESVRLYKSPEQHDVTPSAIFLDRRGNKYLGSRAYANAARNPDNAATLFKRLMGTSTPIRLPAVGVTLTPEECSAEILRLLFGYLPEDIRSDRDTGTVITVPAAFNQMQKDSTMSAAALADVGRVALMQEPVAAVMSVMRSRNSDGIFLVYDLGGGTLNVAVAESISGRVSLLAHGGIAMCGGRDFDRLLYDTIVKPWILERFDLPPDFSANATYKPLARLAVWAAERAKIELSQRDTATVSLSEAEIAVRDLRGDDVYLDIPINRTAFDRLIEARVAETIRAARDTLEKAGLRPDNVERVAFVGGPTHYKPLRDRVSYELGVAPTTDINPMTAVAEGAAVFAESIDWSSSTRGRKTIRGSLAAAGSTDMTFDYIARTPDSRARIVLRTERLSSAVEFQVDSLDSGWSSGRIPFQPGASVDVPLTKPGDNTFKVFVFDERGGPLQLENERIVIARTSATVDAIPASHSVGVEVRDRIGGRETLDFLVREGDQLPHKGRKTFKAGEALRAGAAGSLRFKLWEGDITEPLTDNRFVGVFEIRGTDFDDGAIAAGADLICDYEVSDSGNIGMEVTVPSIAAAFHSGRNFYSRQEGLVDYTNAAKLVREQAENVLQRLDAIESRVSDDRLGEAREKLEHAEMAAGASLDPESAKEAMDAVQKAKRLLAGTRRDHAATIRQIELETAVGFFNEAVRQHARLSEESAFDNLAKTARRALENNSPDFEAHLADLRGRSFMILWRQDWFVIDRFRWLSEATELFPSAKEHAALVQAGREALRASDIDTLRGVVANLDSVRFGTGTEAEMFATVNILRG